jgi:excisionase family DNA binding protein
MAVQLERHGLEHKWFTVGEVAALLQFGLSKTKQLVALGEIRSVKVGGNRRILPQWVDEFVVETVMRGER